MRWLLKLTSTIVFIVTGVLFIAYGLLSYEETIELVSQLLGLSDKKSKLELYLPTHNLRLVQALSILSGMILGAVLFYFSNAISGLLFCVWSYIKYVFGVLVNDWKALSKGEKTVYFIIAFLSLLTKTYYVIIEPLHYDECQTYLLFSSRGVLLSMFSYQEPNNHIFHSVLAAVPLKLSNSIFALRLTALVISFATIPVLFAVFKRLLNAHMALFLLAVFCFLYVVQYYGFHARGYSMLLLAFVVQYYCTYRLIENGAKTFYLFYLGLACIVGLYCMPSYLYCAFPSAVILLAHVVKARSIKVFLPLFYTGAIVGITTLILYLPIIIVNGLSSITSNKWIRPMPRSEIALKLIAKFDQSFDLIFSVGHLTLPILALAILSIILASNKKLAWFTAFFIILSFTVPLLHGIFAYSRTWMHLSIPVLIILGIVLQPVLAHKRGTPVIMAIGVLTIIVQLIAFPNKLRPTEGFAYAGRDIYHRGTAIKAKTIHCTPPEMETILTAYSRLDNSSLTISASEVQEFRLTSPYDYIISNRPLILEGYQLEHLYQLEVGYGTYGKQIYLYKPTQ